MLRGKIIDGHIVYAPKELTIGKTTFIPARDSDLKKDGWLEIVNEPQPLDAPKHKHYESVQSIKDDKIVISWTLVDDSAESIVSELREWFDNQYRTYSEMLTRYEALGIDKSVYDEVRGKTYTCLTDLYLVAEAVRGEINELEAGANNG